jgi:hypothetical protein
MMEIKVEDSGVNSALQTALGHPAPFSAEECVSLEGPLLINQSRDLSALNACPNLRHLEIFASDVASLDALAGLEKLVTLRVACSTVRDIRALAACRALETVDLVFTFAEDLRPLLGLPALRYGVLVGNPWTPDSYHKLRPLLLKMPTERWKRPPVLDFSSQREWELTLELQGVNGGACFATLDTRSLLVRPGPPSFPNSNCDFLPLPLEYVRIDMKEPDFSITKLLQNYLLPGEQNSEFKALDYHSHYIIGAGDDAEAWVRDSPLPDRSKQALMRFIHRFPSLVFYREDDTVLDRVEAARSISLPPWLRQARKALTFVLPHNRIDIQFDTFDHWSNQSEQLGQIWYTFGLIGPNDSRERGIKDEDRLYFPIGEWLATGYSTLAINIADPEDQRVYEYDQQDLISEGEVAPRRAKVIFDSYTGLLGHIVALKLETGEVIRASAG